MKHTVAGIAILSLLLAGAYYSARDKNAPSPENRSAETSLSSETNRPLSAKAPIRSMFDPQQFPRLYPTVRKIILDDGFQADEFPIEKAFVTTETSRSTGKELLAVYFRDSSGTCNLKVLMDRDARRVVNKPRVACR